MPDGRRLLVSVLAAAFIFLVACWQFFGVVDSRPLHRDEARWIHRAVYIRELRQPLGIYWDEATWIDRGGTMDERYRLRAQPPMGSYLMGIGFLLQGQPLPDIGFWNMDEDDAWNAEHGNRPSHQQLITARRTSAMVGALTVLLVFLIASRITNLAGGTIAGLTLAFNPLMIHLATFAGSDAVLGLTIALAAVAAGRLADRPTWPGAFLLGIALALGGATKLSPLGIALPLALLGATGFARWWISRRHGRRSGPPLRLSLQLLAIPVIAGVSFIASYPWLWRNPITNTLALIDYRQWGMEAQGTLWEQVAVPTRVEAFRRVGLRLGQEWTTLGRLPGDRLPDGLELAVASAGLVLLAWLVIQRGWWSATGLIATVLVSEAAITIAGLSADWSRYHLPLLLLACICTGTLVGQGYAWLATRFSWTGLGRYSCPVPSRPEALGEERRRDAGPAAGLPGRG